MVERHTSVDAVGYIALAQSFFQYTGLCVRTVEDSEVVVITVSREAHFGNTVRDDKAFFEIGIGTYYLYFVSLFFFGEYLFGYLLLVLGDEAVGRIDDILCGTVVSFEFEYFQSRVLFTQSEYIVDIRSPERVNALGIVAHHADVVVVFSQLADNEVLGEIGILILVYQDVGEQVAIVLQHVGVIPEKYIGIEQQVVEIHCPRHETALSVDTVYFVNEGSFRTSIHLDKFPVSRIGLRFDEGVFRMGNNRLHG